MVFMIRNTAPTSFIFLSIASFASPVKIFKGSYYPTLCGFCSFLLIIQLYLHYFFTNLLAVAKDFLSCLQSTLSFLE